MAYVTGISGRLRNGVFAAAVALALGFGATQAFAGTAAPGKAAFACSLSQCNTFCRSNCPPGQICRGMCDPDLGCVCYNP
ncbi:MAG: hypothetical protein JO306_06965 [Gemmatimonadetes bacterium]|nr:hypothetical protein [Gemmatimonadota bacterium]